MNTITVIKQIVRITIVSILFLNIVSAQCKLETNFDGVPLGVLPAPGNVPIAREYNEPQVTEQNCPSSLVGRSVQIQCASSGGQGDGVRFTTNFGINPTPLFEAGKKYQISFAKMEGAATMGSYNNMRLKLRASNDTQNGNNCSGSCFVIEDKGVSLTKDECEDWFSTFTPDENYDNLVISSSATSLDGLPVYINIDNICVKEVGDCEASFRFKDLGCGEYEFISTSKGKIQSYKWIIEGKIYSGSNPVHVFSGPGTFSISLTIICESGIEHTYTEDIEVDDFDNIPPVFTKCPKSDTVYMIAPAPDCILFYELNDLGPFDNSGSYTTKYWVDNVLKNPGDLLNLAPGTYTILAIITDKCNLESTCEYIIKVTCDETYPCSNFDDGTIGNWKRYNTIRSRARTDNPTIGSPGASGQIGDFHIKVIDKSGSTWLYNNFDYREDWTKYEDECICFDYNLINDSWPGKIAVTPRIYITSAFNPMLPINWGVNPVLAAVWSANTTVTEDDGWNHFCGKINECDAMGNMPSTSEGSWSMVAGAGSDCNDWHNLLTSVENIMFSVDLSRSISEELYIDNVCVQKCDTFPKVPCPYTTTVDTLVQSNGECCYEMDLDVTGSNLAYVCYNLTTPGVIFNTVMVDTSKVRLDTFTSGNKICFYGKNPGRGGIPMAYYQDLFKFCFANVDSASQNPQCVVADYYERLPNDGIALACSDTMKFQCLPPSELADTCVVLNDPELICDPDNPQRYTMNFTVTNLSNFTASQVVLHSNNPNIKFVPSWAPSGTIPQTSVTISLGSLLPNMTSASLSVIVVSSGAITSPTNFCFGLNIWNSNMCCHSPNESCVILEPCCLPCEDKDVIVKTDSNTASDTTCCHTLDLVNECKQNYFDKIEIVSITPGVIISSHYTGGSNPLDWSNPKSTSTCIQWYHSSGYIPFGTTKDVINFCLNIKDPTTTSQTILLNWYTKDILGEDSIACSDTLIFECDPPIDTRCVEVIEITPKPGPCDSTDCYNEPFCLPWLRFLMDSSNTLSCIPVQTYDHFDVARYNGQSVIVGWRNGAPHGGYEIFACNGDVLQSCQDGVAGLMCQPDAGIDPFTDLTNVNTIWNCGNPVPPLDPNCGISASSYSQMKYCVTFKNNSHPPHYADELLINSITPGVNVLPNPIALIPGLNFCDTATVDFTIYGNLNPGDTIKMEVRLHDGTSGDDWCCFEADTLCLIIPPCPGDTTNCCDISEEEYCNIFDQIITPTMVNDCEVCFDFGLVDSCDEIGISVDGMPFENPELEEVCYSNLIQGVHSFCFTMKRWDNGAIGHPRVCIEKDTCIEIEIKCDTTSCCKDEQDFIQRVNQGWQVTYGPDCEVIVNAPQFDSCHWFGTLSPTWGDGTIVLPSVTSAVPGGPFTHKYKSSGTYNICIYVFEGENENDVCWDATMCTKVTVDCDTCKKSTECLTVTDLEIESFECDTVDCDEDPFCQSWLRNKLAPYAGGCFPPATLDVTKAKWNGETVIIFSYTNLDSTLDEIFDCAGNLIQACSSSLPPPPIPCNPDAGININTDLTNKIQIWKCNDPVPPYNSACKSGNMSVKYCMIVTNKGSNAATQLEIDVLPGQLVTINPAIIILTPPLASGASRKVCYTIDGNMSFDDTIKVTTTIRDTTFKQEWCCMDTDTLCLAIPACPRDSIGCCDISKEEYCDIFNTFVTPKIIKECEVCFDFSDLDKCDELTISIDGGPKQQQPALGVCYDDLSQGVHSFCFTMKRWDRSNPNQPKICMEKDTCFEIEIECDTTASCCDISMADYCKIFEDIVTPTKLGKCKACFDFSDLDKCDELSISIDGGPKMPPPARGSCCYEDLTQGVHSFCFVLTRWDRSNPNQPKICMEKDTCFEIEIECDTTMTCPSCPIGTMQGNDLVVNGDFQGGNTGFMSDYSVGPPNLNVGQYDVRSGSFLGNSNWSALDHTSGTTSGRFLVADGPNPTAAVWRQSLTVIPGNTYVFCAWVNNLVDPKITDLGSPQVEVLINGTIVLVPVTTINQVPDQWILVTGTWTAPAGTTSATIEIFNRQAVAFADLALDDISFTECKIADQPDCCDFSKDTLQSWLDDALNNVKIKGCDVCLNIEGDTCTETLIKWGDGNIANAQMGGGLFCNSYATSGGYSITVTLIRRDNMGEICMEVSKTIEIEVNCCPKGDPCDSVNIMVDPPIDGGEKCCFTVTIDNHYCDTYFKGIKVSMVSPATLSQITALNGWTINQIDPYTAEVYPSGNKIPLGIDKIFTICPENFTNPFQMKISWLVADKNGNCIEVCPQEFERTCTPIPEPNKCVEVVKDSIDCENERYCFKIKNNTNPGFTISSVDVIGVTPSGASLTPSPVGIPPLASGNTSDWICFDYDGVVAGDSLCYYVVAHKEDVTNGKLPTTCCADTVKHCFEVPSCDDCCDLPQDTLQQWLDDAINSISTLACDACIDIKGDSCTEVFIKWGDGSTTNTLKSSGRFCNTYNKTGTYPITVTMIRRDDKGKICMEVEGMKEVIVNCCPDGDPCDSVNIMVDPPIDGGEQCCFTVTIDNHYCETYFKGIKVSMVSPATISQITALNRWTINQIDPYTAEVYPAGNKIPLGIDKIFTICPENFTNPFQMKISWLVADKNGNCIEVCPQEFERTCTPIPEPNKCVEVVKDSIDCENERYCFKIKNNTNPGFTISSVDVIGITPSGASLTPSPVGIPPLAFGKTSDWICFDYKGVKPGDNLCYYVVAHKEDVTNGKLPTTCCADTVKHCFLVPDCPPIDPSCCDIRLKDLNEMLDRITVDSMPPNCNACISYKMDSCTKLILEYGNNVTEERFGNGFICKQFNKDTTITVKVILARLDTSGRICKQVAKVLTIDVKCDDGGEDCCDEDEDELLELIDDGFQFDIDGCEICMPFDNDSCDYLTIDFGDGMKYTGFGSVDICHTYNGNGPWKLNATIERFNTNGDVCIAVDSSITFDLDCKPNVIPCDVNKIVLPNGLTPNGDNLNDVLKVVSPNYCGKIDLSIYNRWGQLVFSQSDYDNTWGGKSIKGEVLPDGTYFIVLSLPDAEGNGTKSMHSFLDIRTE